MAGFFAQGLMVLAGLGISSLACAQTPEEKGVAALPYYQPAQSVSGTLRSWGNPHMAALLKLWQQGFSKFQPEIRYEDTLKSTAMAQWGLQAWVADMALMSRPMIPYESFGTYRRSYNFPVGIEVATGSFDVPGKSYAMAILVHKDNPLTQLTIRQLDGIFSAERTGGWQSGMNWVTKGVARGPEGNIRKWGQLGLTGEWAGREIIPYGPPSLVTGAVSYFQERVSGGAGARNEKLREYADRRLMVEDLGRDRYGIGYTGMCYKTGEVKAIAVSDGDGGPYVEPTRETVADRTYPLTRAPYIYFTVDTKTGDLADPLVDPKVHEFIRYILSRQGQEDVVREGDYLPLTPAVASAMLARLENPPTARAFRKDRRDSDSAATEPVRIRMSDNGDFLVPLLANSLGYFKQEGLELVRLKVTDVAPEDFLLQEPLTAGKIDASYHWFQHTIYGVRHNLPVKAVILLNDAPGAKVMVATRLQGEIRSAADFKGRNVAAGMDYATKGMLTNYLAVKAGLPKHSYRLMYPEEQGRQQAVVNGLKDGTVDIATFMEPMTSVVEETGLVTTLYDLTSREGTAKALGAAYPGQSILMAPKYIEEHPDTVQHLVNAMVRTLRFMNSHTAEEIAARLPPEYFNTADHMAELNFIRRTLPSFARGDYSFSPASVQLAIDTVHATDFDGSVEGVWRRTVENPEIVPEQLYTNTFVEKAMKEIR